MARKNSQEKLKEQLLGLVAEACPGMTVELGHSERWDRPLVTFTWAGFSGLLPEERYHRLARLIPESFRREDMRGYVWLELVPDEDLEQFLKMPRSEDIKSRRQEIYNGLLRADFFSTLSEAMDGQPVENCGGGFQKLRECLKLKRFSAKHIDEAKMLFICYGAFCDCQAVVTIQPKLEEEFGASGD